MNPLQTNRNFIIPILGEGVTIGIGSDAYPATIIEVSKNLKKVVLQIDHTEPAEGFEYYGNQVYDITPDTDGRTETWTYRKRGVWAQLNSAKAVGYLSFSGRRKYSDPSF
jgi:hypothetical protein